MRNGICIGIALGMIVGAFCVNNCSQVRTLVDKAQTKIKSKMQKANDVIMSNMESAEDNIVDMQTSPECYNEMN